jgi:hypothetical protein
LSVARIVKIVVVLKSTKFGVPDITPFSVIESPGGNAPLNNEYVRLTAGKTGEADTAMISGINEG